LLECDFVKASGSYTSMHLAVDTPVIAAKALGAILLVTLRTPMPDLKLIKGLGQ
jgi:hypothetical protein